MSKVVVITTSEQYFQFKKSHKRAVIFYGANWCEACQIMHNIYERIAARYQKYVTMAYVDIDVCKLDFSCVPIFVSLFDGKELNSVEGSDRKGLKHLIKEVIQRK